MKNYYQILEVNENASPEVIEKAYKVLAKKYHPDTYPKDKIYWAENKFKEITEAYNVLSNSYSRFEYDAKMGFDNYSYKASNVNNQNAKSYQEQNNSDTKPEKETDKKFSLTSSLKQFVSSIATLIYNETKKPKEERSKDMIALVLTIIIVTIIVIVFWKVPFLKNIIFP